MSTLDIVILVVFGAAAVYGFWRGLVLQFGTVAGVIIGILCCRLFGDWTVRQLADILPAMGQTPEVSRYIYAVIANVILFILGFFVTRILASAVKTVVNAIFMGWVDRILGALFSAFAWMLVLSILLNIGQSFSSTDIIAGCRLGGGLAAKAVMDLAPSVLGFADLNI